MDFIVGLIYFYNKMAGNLKHVFAQGKLLGINLFTGVVPFFADERLNVFFEGLFRIGDDTFSFAVWIIFEPVSYFFIPLILSLHGNSPVFMKHIIVSIFL